MVIGSGEGFDLKSVSPFSEGEEENVIAQLIRVRDDREVSSEFSINRSTRIRIYAIGEGVDRRMVDYGWIEEARTGKTVWEMTYGMTSRAGGARKNTLVNAAMTPEQGTYKLHYRTDDSHASNDWNDNPPEDRVHWGITIYKEE